MDFVQDRGTVVNCESLQILETPDEDSMILGVIPMLTEVMIKQDESTEDYYKICTATSLEGYCQKKFIALPLS